jgi:hypothetical protein
MKNINNHKEISAITSSKISKTKRNKQRSMILGMCYGLGLGAIITLILKNVIYLSIGIGVGSLVGLVIAAIKNRFAK